MKLAIINIYNQPRVTSVYLGKNKVYLEQLLNGFFSNFGRPPTTQEVKDCLVETKRSGYLPFNDDAVKMDFSDEKSVVYELSGEKYSTKYSYEKIEEIATSIAKFQEDIKNLSILQLDKIRSIILSLESTEAIIYDLESQMIESKRTFNRHTGEFDFVRFTGPANAPSNSR